MLSKNNNMLWSIMLHQTRSNGQMLRSKNHRRSRIYCKGREEVQVKQTNNKLINLNFDVLIFFFKYFS